MSLADIQVLNASLKSAALQPGNFASISKAAAYLGTISSFILLNSSMNMLNRYVLGVYGFKYPMCVTFFHLAFGFTVLLPIMLSKSFRDLHRATLRSQWKGIVAVGTFKVANIVLNNMSLVTISLSLNQIIRSAIPVVTALLGVVIEKKVPTQFELSSLVILTVGVVLSVWEGTVEGAVGGVLIAVASVLAGAAMLNFSGKVLSERLDVMRLTFYTAPVSCSVLLPFLLYQEWSGVQEYWATHDDSSRVRWFLIIGGANAVLYNMVHYATIQLTSAVTTPVIGMIKVVGIVILSALYLGERDLFTARMTAGCTLAIAGFTMYSYAKVAAVTAAQHRMARQRKTSEANMADEEAAHLMRDSSR